MDKDYNKFTVEKAMTKNVFAATVNTKVSDVINAFVTKNFNHIPVINQDKLVGIISVRDLLSKMVNHTLKIGHLKFDELDKSLSISELMTPNPITISGDKTIEEAKYILSKSDFQALPVVNGDKLVGIITIKDLVKLKIIKIDGSDYNPI